MATTRSRRKQPEEKVQRSPKRAERVATRVASPLARQAHDDEVAARSAKRRTHASLVENNHTPRVEAPKGRDVKAPGETVAIVEPHPSRRTPAKDAPDFSWGPVMELSWDDDAPQPTTRRGRTLAERWLERGDALLRSLAEHGATKDEVRVDLSAGRFVWIDAEGRVSAEARAELICTYSPVTSALTMGWADPIGQSASIARLDGVAAERDSVDEEGAWRVAMEAADVVRAEYLYRLMPAHAWYFLALRDLSFARDLDTIGLDGLDARGDRGRPPFSPGPPFELVLRLVAEVIRSVASRAEPAMIVHRRLADAGAALAHEARSTYRDTEWVMRLIDAGRTLTELGARIVDASPEWLGRDDLHEILTALRALEDEWRRAS